MSMVEAERLQYVSVSNGLDYDIDDMYDGIPIRIQAGKKDNLRIDVAAHIFGYYPDVTNETMFRYFSKRQGWNTKEWMALDEASGKSKAQLEFEKIVIKPVTFRLVPAEEGPSIPADPDVRAAPRRIEVNPR
jgi:hypothetical protein